MSRNGGGYIAFSTGGEKFYFSERIEETYLDWSGEQVVNFTGSVKEFHAQLGNELGTTLNSISAMSKTQATNFLPSVIQVGHVGIFVIDEFSNKVLLKLSSDDSLEVVYTATKEACTIGDIAVHSPSNVDQALLLVLCVNNGKVFSISVFIPLVPPTPSTTPLTTVSILSQKPVSIAFDNIGEGFFVAVKLDDPSARGVPHIFRYSQDGSAIGSGLLKVSCSKSRKGELRMSILDALTISVDILVRIAFVTYSDVVSYASNTTSHMTRYSYCSSRRSAEARTPEMVLRLK